MHANCPDWGKSDRAGHSFTAWVVKPEYLKSEAAYTQAAVYYKSCAVCKLSGAGTDGAATFEDGEPLPMLCAPSAPSVIEQTVNKIESAKPGDTVESKLPAMARRTRKFLKPLPEAT